MYTNIPTKEAVEETCRRLIAAKFNYHGLDGQDLYCLLMEITNEFTFSFNSKTYRQTKGLPMGSRISGLLATVFLDSVESKIIHDFKIPFYRRYVDDTFLLARDREEASAIHQAFNTAHPSIRFEIEHPEEDPSGYMLKLLDVSIHISKATGFVSFGYFQKAARSDVFVNAHSWLPSRTKENIIENEKQRILERCSNDQQANTEMAKFHRKLQRNGYEGLVIQKRKKRKTAGSSNANPTRKPFFFSARFVSEKVDRQLRTLFKKMQIPVIMAHRGRTLRGALNKTKKMERMERCNINRCKCPKDLCHANLVIYQCQCSVCHSRYIGSTKRRLHLRVREHCSMQSSAVFQHTNNCEGAQWEVTVLDKARDLVDLRLREGMAIMTRQPELNNREEVGELSLI